MWWALAEGEFREIGPGADGRLESRCFPGLWLDPVALLRGDLQRVLATLPNGLESPEHRALIKLISRTVWCDGAPTLATKLGTTTHLSALLHKARRLGCGARELEILAVQRGCVHYSSGSEPEGMLVSDDEFSSEGTRNRAALHCTAIRATQHSVRSSDARCRGERSAPTGPYGGNGSGVLSPCAMWRTQARRFEPENPFWLALMNTLPSTPPPKPGVLPHPTRFVAMTGYTRQGRKLVVEWQRPTPAVPDPDECGAHSSTWTPAWIMRFLW